MGTVKVCGNYRTNSEISGSLEKNGHVTFIGKDKKRHKAVVSDGLVILDGDVSMTWDSFTYIYLDRIVEGGEY